ncbi:TonB-dependent receptor [Bryobacter aggregatus]|uniref:TonB-dependent receptor n=1 Tax=Bryobacter aggregatus TaxID=360054 RepID=UPI0009B5CEEE|nr:TonB-dependent receptor [Bryobacter aggregatus]
MRTVRDAGKRMAVGLLVLAGLVWDPALLPGQQNAATIVGSVSDASGAAIAGAKLTALDEATGFARSAESDANGSFVIPLIPIGTYRINAEAPGFKVFSRKGVELQLNQSARINIEMQVGSVAESIEVGDQAPLVDTASSAGGEVVDRKRIAELPLNGRNPLQLATLLPGVTVSSNPVALTGGNRNGNSVSVNGSRTNETDYQLDGMRFAGGYTNSGLNYPSPDALQEFKLITNSYSAEYGFYAGSIFTAVTRSGTNQIHGSAWEFFRNDKLNARNFFSATVPILRQNQFGASIGFPILKNKLFGFASYQGLRIRGTSIASSFPLTAAERQGIFSSTIRDPRTNLPFPNNTIPADRINPVTARLLKDIIPVAPGSESGQLVTSGSNPIDGNHYLGKLDYLISSKDTLSLSYFFDKTSFKTPFASGPYPVYGQREEDQVIPVASMNYTRTFTPTLLNQLRVGISGQEENRRCSSGLTPRALGMNIDLEGPPEPPSISVTGRFNIGGGGLCLWVEGTNNYQFADSLTWIKGRHQIKAGFDLYRRKFKLITAAGDPGNFGFDGSATGNAAADFLLGELVTASRRPLIDLAMRSINSSFFVQDDFKVSRRLTLNLGLRYELLGPFDETRGVERSTVKIPQNATFRQGVQSTVIPSAPPGLLFTGDKAPDFPDGLPSTMVRMDHKQIQPRIGMAYDLTGDGLTSLRASYGLYSNAHFGDMGAQSFQNQPFLLGQTLFRPAGA